MNGNEEDTLEEEKQSHDQRRIQYNLLRQYLFNELGITRDQIMGWVKEAVEETIRKRFDEPYIEKRIEDLSRQAFRQYAHSSVLDRVAWVLASEMKIVPKEGESND